MNLEIKKTIEFLKKGKIILYPTDTIWGIGCDATNFEAIAKIYKLKKRDLSKSMIILVNNIEMLQKIVNISKKELQIITNLTIPTTIIYKNPKNIAKNLISTENTLAIRVVKDDFCKNLIKSFGKPIVSTSANISNEKPPNSFEQISDKILESVDYCVNLKIKNNAKASKIIRIENGEITVIRNN